MIFCAILYICKIIRYNIMSKILSLMLQCFLHRLKLLISEHVFFRTRKNSIWNLSVMYIYFNIINH